MNGPNRHSAFVAGTIKGVPFSAIVDGIPDNCDHDYSGDTVYITSSGKEIYWHTFRQWAAYTEELRGPLIHKHQSDLEDPVLEVTTSCRHCKKLFHPPMFDI